jgi:DNA-binding NarL/FixJ family response regulator
MKSGYPGGLASPSVGHEGLAVSVAIGDGLLRRRVLAALAAGGIALAEDDGVDGSTADVVIVGRGLDTTQVVELRSELESFRPTPVVIVAPRTGAAGLRRALGAGARAIVFDLEVDVALPSAVRAAAVGQTCVPCEVNLVSDKPTLSHREREVLKLAVSGRTNGEIAAALCLAESTVKSHLSAAFSRLGVRSRREAATLVLDPEQGLGPIVLGTKVAMPGMAGANGAPSTG